MVKTQASPVYELESAQHQVAKHFKNYPNASISAMFRKLRENQKYRYFGDYLLLRLIVETARDSGVTVKKEAVYRAVSYSPELKGQRIVLTTLFSHQLEAFNLAKTPYASSEESSTCYLSPNLKGGKNGR